MMGLSRKPESSERPARQLWRSNSSQPASGFPVAIHVGLRRRNVCSARRPTEDLSEGPRIDQFELIFRHLAAHVAPDWVWAGC